MVGLIILRHPIIEILFQRGAFTATSTRLTAQALLFYSLGLWGFAGVRVIVPAFYALKDMVTPVKVAALALAANLVLSLALMGPLKHGGLALATSSASALNFCLLAVILVRRLGNVQLAEIGYSLLKVALACVPMGLAAFFLAKGNPITLLGGDLDRALNLALAILAAAGVYLLFSYIFKSKELTALKQMLRPRIKGSDQ
jgi:putative peptidoglycan lipid II flippase